MTVSEAVGEGPLPSLIVLYCKPLSVAVTPSLDLFSVRNASPATMFICAVLSSAGIGVLLVLVDSSSSSFSSSIISARVL